MENKYERLNDIKTENFIWIIYIGIIILSYYSNYKEKQFILYNDLKSKREYQNLIILIFAILNFIYMFFVKSSIKNIQKLNIYDTNKKKILSYAELTASSLVLISGIIFLIITILDGDIDIELAFN